MYCQNHREVCIAKIIEKFILIKIWWRHKLKQNYSNVYSFFITDISNPTSGEKKIREVVYHFFLIDFYGSGTQLTQT